MSDSVQPHRRKPTRLRHPWDSPGKNTGVGCHFLLQCMKVKRESEVAQSCPTLSNPLDYSLPGSSVHGFSRQEYWSGVPLPSPWYLMNTGQLRIWSCSLSLSDVFSWFNRGYVLGKNTTEVICSSKGIRGYMILINFIFGDLVSLLWSYSVVSDPQKPHGLQPTRLLCPWDFPGKTTGVGCHCFLWRDA